MCYFSFTINASEHIWLQPNVQWINLIQTEVKMHNWDSIYNAWGAYRPCWSGGLQKKKRRYFLKKQVRPFLSNQCMNQSLTMRAKVALTLLFYTTSLQKSIFTPLCTLMCRTLCCMYPSVPQTASSHSRIANQLSLSLSLSSMLSIEALSNLLITAVARSDF